MIRYRNLSIEEALIVLLNAIYIKPVNIELLDGILIAMKGMISSNHRNEAYYCIQRNVRKWSDVDTMAWLSLLLKTNSFNFLIGISLLKDCTIESGTSGKSRSSTGLFNSYILRNVRCIHTCHSIF